MSIDRKQACDNGHMREVHFYAFLVLGSFGEDDWPTCMWNRVDVRKDYNEDAWVSYQLAHGGKNGDCMNVANLDGWERRTGCCYGTLLAKSDRVGGEGVCVENATI